ncbi:N2,N2-dimethylguanosine tRNA methyltransferase [Mitosporidium daphniae]|uniref:tRNA (guanine(26)-N(2))-dimethyltransferase n=1 Tax=Mitosporidium daphniae TaxID=1485682 RepID=A0A098VNT6_9MICR|nr:N2,N2-dimethylguanosine tRNA methyltransferase [Mitosporidium daphniae]KGG50439.1 N2,N2-dimethylguanosine tRNA methyltransferase [Mitosporidium daphniae]|eukprot:XP_013236866.1 N2,N2-dimethylguanosine tRNA methyltransferase [Mitosporidium daphniae]
MPSGTECSLDAPNGYKIIQEGISSILVPDNRSVFYNPVQEFNRDLSMLIAHLFSKLFSKERDERAKAKPSAARGSSASTFKILDALTASGFRAIRYAHQVPLASQIISNDLDHGVRETISANIAHNAIKEDLIKINIQDAKYAGKQSFFDLIDVDPYGSASPFLDAAVQAVSSGGLLAITSTDMAVLCGVHPGTCFAKYQGVPLHSDYSQEMAIRLLLNAVETAANRYGRYIEPLVSVKIDFYVRIFVRVHKGPLEVKKSVKKRALVLACPACRTFFAQPIGAIVANDKYAYSPLAVSCCSICSSTKLQVAGPIWSANLHSKEFVLSLQEFLSSSTDFILGTRPRICGFLSLLSEVACLLPNDRKLIRFST